MNQTPPHINIAEYPKPAGAVSSGLEAEALLLGLVIALCLLCSAFFSGSETALLRLSRREMEQEAKQEDSGLAATAARELLKNTSRLLVTLLIGNNLVNILGAVVASALAVSLLGERLGILVATLVMTLLVLIACEIFPKALAARSPKRVGLLIAMPVYLLHQLLRPVHILFDHTIEPILRRFGAAEREGLTAETLMRLARDESEENGEGEEAEKPKPLAIIGATAGAAEMQVEEIMTPRAEIFAVSVTEAPAEVLKTLLEGRYSRIPVYEDSIDNVLGICHLKDLARHLHSGNGFSLREILKPALKVPERKPILQLLADMQSRSLHMAIVQNAEGDTLGLCTQEDILEEIVGEIRDEFDSEELNMIHKTDSFCEAPARVKVRDFNRSTGLSVPAERGDTLGGLVFNTLGRAPNPDECVEIPGFKLTITGAIDNPKTRVRITPREEAPAQQAQDQAGATPG